MASNRGYSRIISVAKFRFCHGLSSLLVNSSSIMNRKLCYVALRYVTLRHVCYVTLRYDTMRYVTFVRLRYVTPRYILITVATPLIILCPVIISLLQIF